MTTLAAIFGALPLIVASGPGSELRRPLGITIVGGLIVAQFLTIYTTPVIYLVLDRLRWRFTRRGRAAACPTMVCRHRRNERAAAAFHCHPRLDRGSA